MRDCVVWSPINWKKKVCHLVRRKFSQTGKQDETICQKEWHGWLSIVQSMSSTWSPQSVCREASPGWTLSSSSSSSSSLSSVVTVRMCLAMPSRHLFFTRLETVCAGAGQGLDSRKEIINNWVVANKPPGHRKVMFTPRPDHNILGLWVWKTSSSSPPQPGHRVGRHLAVQKQKQKIKKCRLIFMDL